MKSHRISLKAELDSRVGAADLLTAPGDAVLVTRGSPRWLLLKCPCGCGQEIPVNLDTRAGKAWRLYRTPSAGLTVFPSVWRDTGCESHFIIWRDQILLFGQGDESSPLHYRGLDMAALSSRLLRALPPDRLVSYVEVADTLREIPWDVQQACRVLVKNGALVEGLGQQSGCYRLVRPRTV